MSYFVPMPVQVRIIYSVALAFFALGAVLFFVKANDQNCVVSWVPGSAASWPTKDFRMDPDLGVAVIAAKACADPAEMTTTRIWGISLAAFAVTLIGATWWQYESASARRDFYGESD